ncbi:MAG TPA: tetratricopeptide repeat protein [bacterium]|nr:tetratricopeptide repeat protein [bacterium]
MIRAVLAAMLVAAVAPKTGKAHKVLHPETAEEYLTLSNAQLQLGKFADAEKTARAGLLKHPDSQGFHLLLGEIYAGREKPADAFYEYQWEILRAGGAAPSGKTAADKIGDLLQNARGTGADEMRKVAEAIVATRTDPPTALKLLGQVYDERGGIFVLRLLLAEANVEAGNASKAESLYRGLISDDERFVPAYVELANLLKGQGKTKEADSLVKKAKEIDPDSWALAPEPTPEPSPSASP